MFLRPLHQSLNPHSFKHLNLLNGISSNTFHHTSPLPFSPQFSPPLTSPLNASPFASPTASYPPRPSIHCLLHRLILTGTAKPTSILDELARSRERLNIDTTTVFDALIRVYIELNMPNEALECFNMMKQKGFLPKIETRNQVLFLFLKWNRTRDGNVIRHFETLGVEPAAVYNYNTLIHDGAKFEAACVMFQDMTDDGLVLSAYRDNSYIFVMCKEGRLEEASDLLPEMFESDSGLVPHAAIYDALIKKYCREAIEGSMVDLEKAIAYKVEMISRGIEPTRVTYTMLSEAWFEFGDSCEGGNMIKEIQEKGMKPDVYTYYTLMSGYAKRKYMDRHISLYDEVVEKRIQPNLLTYNTMILAYCKCSEVEEAQKLFDEMKTRGIKPDYISYNLLIGGYSEKEGDVKEAFRVRDEMLKNGFDPTFIAYDALIICLCDNNEVEHAEEILKEMVSKGICTPDDWKYLVLTKIIKETSDQGVGNARFRKILEDDKYLYFNQPLPSFIIKEIIDQGAKNARFRKILEDDKYLYFNQPLQIS